MSEEKYLPKSKIGQWFDSRLPLLSLMHHLRDELPYSVECQIDHFEDKKKIVMIDLMIRTKKPAHKKIIIGKGGQLLKIIATEARLEMENLLNKKVFLSTQVRSIKKGKSLSA